MDSITLAPFTNDAVPDTPDAPAPENIIELPAIKSSPAFDLWFDLYNSKEVNAVLMMCPEISEDFSAIYKNFSNTNDWELLSKILLDALLEAEETIRSNPHNTFISFCRYPSINTDGCLRKFYENTTEAWRRSGRYDS